DTLPAFFENLTLMNNSIKTLMKIDLNWLTATTYTLLSILGSFLAPVGPFIIFSIFLVTADFITGVKAAKVRGEKLISRGFRRSIEKMLIYFLILLASEG